MVNNYYNNGWAKRADELEAHKAIKSSQKDTLKEMINSPDKENAYMAKELMRLKIADVLIEGLNKGQLAAFLEMIEFFRTQDPKEDAIVLKGYAGTGKTFLVKRVIEYIRTAYPSRKIAITAPTNKAVQVLNKNTPFADDSAVFEDFKDPDQKIVYSTIHKLLGLKENVDQNGNRSFKSGSKKDNKIAKFKYLVLDEVSMLSDELFIELMQYKSDLKFIFMGDPAQIPPIGKEHCIPFSDDCPYPLKKLELTEIMRQKGEHPIVDSSMVLRHNLREPIPLPDLKTSLNADGNGIIYFDKTTKKPMVRKTIEKYFTNEKYKDNTDFIKVLAWRNKTVDYVNHLVKQTLYGDNIERFNVGDKLVANSALFKRGHNEWGFQYAIKATTSQEFVIKEISIVNRDFNENVKTSPNIKFSGKFWKLDVEVEGEDIIEETLYVIHDQSFDEYAQILKELKDIAVKSKDRNTWIMYYNMLKWSDDVTYNYAITVHKAQGSTYENVILLEEDLDFNRKTVEKNRIKYTAYTRAERRVYILR